MARKHSKEGSGAALVTGTVTLAMPRVGGATTAAFNPVQHFPLSMF